MEDLLHQYLSSRNAEKFRAELDKQVNRLISEKNPDASTHNAQVNSLLEVLRQGNDLLPRYFQEKYLKALEKSRIITKGQSSIFSFSSSQNMKPASQLISKDEVKETHENKVQWTIHDIENQSVVHQCNGELVSLHKVKNSTVLIPNETPALTLNSIEDSIIIVPHITGSARITGCHRCKFVLSLKQLRIHDTSECDFYISVYGNPIIEKCNKLRFGPFDVSSPSSCGPWNNVKDFDFATEDHSPNWCEIPVNERNVPKFQESKNL
ncbi:tubulin-folding cofactor C [Histomonas meleagridis]|uniref:tubulin-folding cofactor C n=1 Tax=Histomonas meleagridis TaxID=135588 RepID=UPI003559ADD4|nr:tubulin-folding cofactor C [Histomonas meleagridis]KAH0806765.1 tubulin-folding cofactor C [Histomonas meleagridis]